MCAEGRAARDAGNYIRPEGAASLAPALEKMPQLTLFGLQFDSEDAHEYEEQEFDSEDAHEYDSDDSRYGIY